MRVLGHDGIALPEPVVRASRALQDWLQELDGDSPLVANPPEELVLERMAGADAQRLQEFLEAGDAVQSCHQALPLLPLLIAADFLNMAEALQAMQQALASLWQEEDMWVLLHQLPGGLAEDTLPDLLWKKALLERLAIQREANPHAPWPHVGQGQPANRCLCKQLAALWPHSGRDICTEICTEMCTESKGQWVRLQPRWSNTTMFALPGPTRSNDGRHRRLCNISLLRISVCCDAARQPCWSMLQGIEVQCGNCHRVQCSGLDTSELHWLTAKPMLPPSRHHHEDGTQVLSFMLPLLPVCKPGDCMLQPSMLDCDVNITLCADADISLHAVEVLQHKRGVLLDVLHPPVTRTLFTQVHACRMTDESTSKLLARMPRLCLDPLPREAGFLPQRGRSVRLHGHHSVRVHARAKPADAACPIIGGAPALAGAHPPLPVQPCRHRATRAAGRARRCGRGHSVPAGVRVHGRVPLQRAAGGADVCSLKCRSRHRAARLSASNCVLHLR